MFRKIWIAMILLVWLAEGALAGSPCEERKIFILIDQGTVEVQKAALDRGLRKLLSDNANFGQLALLAVDATGDSVQLLGEACLLPVPDMNARVAQLEVEEGKSQGFWERMVENLVGPDLGVLEQRNASRQAVVQEIQQAQALRRKIYQKATTTPPTGLNLISFDLLKPIFRAASEQCLDTSSQCQVHIFSRMLDRRSSGVFDAGASGSELGATHGQYMLDSREFQGRKAKMDVLIWGFGFDAKGQGLGAHYEAELRAFWKGALTTFADGSLVIGAEFP